MGTPNFNFNFLGSNEAAYAQAIRDIASALAVMLDGVEASNPPTGAIRWSSANSRLEKFNGTTWAALCTLFDMNVLRLNGYQSTDFALAGHNHAGVYQPKDAELTAIAGLTSAADKAPYFTGSGAAELMTVTSVARTLLAATTAAAQRTALGLAIGSNVQAYSAVLAGLATAITETDELVYSTGSNVFDTCPFPAQARTLLAATTAALQRAALGLGSAATLDAGTAANALVQLNASGQLPAVNAALVTGLSALAKFATVANRVLYVNSAGEPVWLALGAAGTVLQSNGASVAPTFEEAGAGGEWERVSETVVSTSVVSVDFAGLDFTVYDYKINVRNAVSTAFGWRIGIGSTPTYITAGYSYTKELNNTIVVEDSFAYVILPVIPVAGYPNMSDLVVSSTSTHVIGDSTQSAGSTACILGRGVGYKSLTGIATAVQFWSGANITAGTFTLYRREK